VEKIEAGDMVKVYTLNGDYEGRAQVVRYNIVNDSFIIRFDNESEVYTKKIEQLERVG